MDKEKKNSQIDFIFELDKSGNFIKIKNNFEELYKNISDPWNQEIDNKYNFYKKSRHDLVNIIKNMKYKLDILEVGCGTGKSTNDLQDNLPNSKVSGCDISKTAVTIAKNKYINDFFILDIMNPIIEKKYDIVILSHIIWYYPYDIEKLLNNSRKIINDNGSLIIQQSFFMDKYQNFFRDIFIGYYGFTKHIKSICNKNNLVCKSHMFKYSDKDVKDNLILGIFIINI